MKKRLFGLSLFLTILELVSPGCSTPEKPEKPLLEPAKQLGTAEPEKKPVVVPEEKPAEKPEAPKEITLEDAIRDANLRPQHLRQVPKSEYIAGIFYCDNQQDREEFGKKFVELYNPTREEMIILEATLRTRNKPAMATMPERLVGQGLPQLILVTPSMYMTFRYQGEVDALLIDQMGQCARDAANGFVFDDIVILPDVSTAEKAPPGKKLVKVNTPLYNAMDYMRGLYAMIEGIASGKRKVSKFCKTVVYKEYMEKYMNLKLYAIGRRNQLGRVDDVVDTIGRTLCSFKWIPRVDNGQVYLDKRD
ncbi:hypothetical protein KY310_01540 [Candidatus Woesearchaeota archaeon]|nr:hypothetical protein [Candidatus Woesearchaeota archaeon]